MRDVRATILPRRTHAVGKVTQLIVDEKEGPLETDGQEAAKKLNAAARNGKIDVVRRLLASGVSIEAKDPGCDATPLMSAALAGKTDVMRLLLENGADTDAHGDESELTPLICAAGNGWLDAVRTLLEHGVSPDQRGHDGHTALVAALRRGHADVVTFLLQHGADPNAQTGTGVAALHWAVAEDDDPTMLEILIAHGANVNIPTKAGRTPLMHAASCGRASYVRGLLRAGADVFLRDSEGRTALGIAVERQQTAVAEVLRQSGAVE